MIIFLYLLLKLYCNNKKCSQFGFVFVNTRRAYLVCQAKRIWIAHDNDCCAGLFRLETVIAYLLLTDKMFYICALSHVFSIAVCGIAHVPFESDLFANSRFKFEILAELCLVSAWYVICCECILLIRIWNCHAINNVSCRSYLNLVHQFLCHE